jgi:L-asparaginase II
MTHGYRPVIQATRGGVVESIHFGAIAVADAQGNLLASWGDPELQTFMRSSAKPFQALPTVESGTLEAFGLADEDLALFCASHAGTDDHVSAVASIQARVGLPESALQCGTHPPLDRKTAFRLRSEGIAPTPNRHNCSGKHTGMLAQAKHIGASLDTYLSPENPVQQRILAALAAMADLKESEILVGTDGCSAPNFAIPLRAAATAYARLADPTGLPPERAQACDRIFRAMTSHPTRVSGEGFADAVLMESVPGVLAKAGAEGYQGLAIRPSALGGGRALGVAFKISDGDPAFRAQGPMVLSVLHQLGVDGVLSLGQRSPFGPMDIQNHAGLTIGQVETCFELSAP